MPLCRLYRNKEQLRIVGLLIPTLRENHAQVLPQSAWGVSSRVFGASPSRPDASDQRDLLSAGHVHSAVGQGLKSHYWVWIYGDRDRGALLWVCDRRRSRRCPFRCGDAADERDVGGRRHIRSRGSRDSGSLTLHVMSFNDASFATVSAIVIGWV